MRVYLSGPDVFFPNAIEIGQAKKEICARFGLEGVYPLDADFSGLLELSHPADMGYASFRLMVGLMDSCDLVIANMTPFRGPSMDVGTAVEIGYMHGRGKPVFGYTNVVADYADRVTPDGFTIEPFGLIDNCMVEGPVHETGAMRGSPCRTGGRGLHLPRRFHRMRPPSRQADVNQRTLILSGLPSHPASSSGPGTSRPAKAGGT